ncbi:MAG: 7-cyano-7-deazaguanine synthase QueC [Deltaproteobacteria bacterium]|nr:7-cyano-7-deazaguanine synthase QueC [Deltaproteobacteria bacterium]
MDKAVVIFSGGQDSTTCLGWAKNRYEDLEGISFNYGQRHHVETDQAKIIADKLGVPLTLFDISFYSKMVISALTGEGNVNLPHEDNHQLPASFVPNRNALFILLAHSFAQTKKAKVLIGGFCQTDFSGYPDCRETFTELMLKSLNLGSDQHIELKTPLMHLSKAETFKLAQQEGILDLVIRDSHTCYEGSPAANDWGRGCGNCPACLLRKKGYLEFIQL